MKTDLSLIIHFAGTFSSCERIFRLIENWNFTRVSFANFRFVVADLDSGRREKGMIYLSGVADASRCGTDEYRVYRVASWRKRRESDRTKGREREREGARERKCARERYVGVRERSRLVKPLSEKPAWLLDRPALRSVLHCAPCEAELSRYLPALPLTLVAIPRDRFLDLGISARER